MAVKKAPAKKAPAKRAPAKKAAEEEPEAPAAVVEDDSPTERGTKRPKVERKRKPGELDLTVKMVLIDKLKTYPGNPNEGDVAGIAESLSVSSQYRAIVVQKSTSYVLAGNHTYLAAKSLGWRNIAAHVVDVDDEAAKKIVIADNNLPKHSTINEQKLAELLNSMDDVTGTGFTEREAQALINTIEDAVGEIAEAVVDTLPDPDVVEEMMRGADGPLASDLLKGKLPGAEDDDDYEEEEDEPQPFLDAPDDTGGVFELKDDMAFPTRTKWEVPYLRDDMMIEELPEPLDSWGGSATRDWPDENQWWLYNFGVDSTSGMRDASKIVLSFYTWDEYFDPWWWQPAKYMTRALNSGIKYAITPNYTQGGMDMALSLWNLYRSRWVGRYMQEIGIRVMPDLEVRQDSDAMLEVFKATLPKQLPWASIQVQNFNHQSRGGEAATAERIAEWGKQMKDLLGIIEIDNLLVYANERGQNIVADLNLDVNIRPIGTRLEKLRASQAKREKKVVL